MVLDWLSSIEIENIPPTPRSSNPDCERGRKRKRSVNVGSPDHGRQRETVPHPETDSVAIFASDPVKSAESLSGIDGSLSSSGQFNLQSAEKKLTSSLGSSLTRLNINRWSEHYTIQIKEFPNINHISKDCKGLFQAMKDLADRKAILSADTDDPTLRAVMLADNPHIDIDSVEEKVKYRSYYCSRKTFGIASLSKVKEIVWESNFNDREFELEESEAQWNCNVHYPLLKLIQLNHTRGRRRPDHQPSEMQVMNLTTPSLINRDISGGKTASPSHRKIDFAVALFPPSSIMEALRENGLKSLTPSSQWQLSDCCLMLEIVTRRGSDNEKEAVMQILPWQCRQREILQNAMKQKDRNKHLVLPRPNIIVLGPRWYFRMVEHVVDENGRDIEVVWSKIEMGSTSDSVGVYKIIACIRRLFGWGEEEYQPWLVKNIVPEGLDWSWAAVDESDML